MLILPSAVAIPFQPLLVTALHTSLMEVFFICFYYPPVCSIVQTVLEERAAYVLSIHSFSPTLTFLAGMQSFILIWMKIF
jgi:hypothetical protein